MTKNYTCLSSQGSAHSGYNIYRQFVRYRCNKPGTPEAKCIGTAATELVMDCPTDTRCVEGRAYCLYVNPESSTKTLFSENTPLPSNYTRFFTTDKEYRNFTVYNMTVNEVLYTNTGYYGFSLLVKVGNSSPTELLLKKYGKTTYDDLMLQLEKIGVNETEVIAELYVKIK